MLQPKYTIELIQFRTSMGPDIAKLNGYKKVVEWNDILPLLREGRRAAQALCSDYECRYDDGALLMPSYQSAKSFLDATAAIEEEKGVEG